MAENHLDSRAGCYLILVQPVDGKDVSKSASNLKNYECGGAATVSVDLE